LPHTDKYFEKVKWTRAKVAVVAEWSTQHQV